MRPALLKNVYYVKTMKLLYVKASLRQIRTLWLVLSRSGFCVFFVVLSRSGFCLDFECILRVYTPSRVFLFWIKAGKFKIWSKPKLWKKREYCHSSQRNYQEKLRILKFLPRLQRWMKKTNILLSWRSGNFWCRNCNRRHGKSGSHRRFYQPTEKSKHKQEDGYWYEHSSPVHGSWWYEKWENW